MVLNKNKIYAKYKKVTNMTYSKLLKWCRNPLSQTVSVKKKFDSVEARAERRKLLLYMPFNKRQELKQFNTAQIRNLVLLFTPKSRWDEFLLRQANKAISYLARAKKIKGIINSRALKNWAYDSKR